MEFISDGKAVEYIKSFKKKAKTPLKEIYPGSTDESIDFLNKTIIFNPKKRLTIDEALAHPLLQKVRDPKKEIVASGAIALDFEKEGDLTENRLRELFAVEIAKYIKK